MATIDKSIVGKRFGKLVVLDEYEIRTGRKTYWLCQCDCGDKKFVYRGSLIKEKTKSCGCIVSTLNGLSDSRLYKIWWGIKERCYNQNHHEYYNYGGKGIVICEEWQDFMKFYNWAMKNGYNENLTIDREDSNKSYIPENCRWITKSENTASANRTTHRRKTEFLYYGMSPDGERYEFANANEFARQHDLNAGCLRGMANGEKYKNSLYKGWKFGFTNKKNI